MKTIITAFAILVCAHVAFAQKYFTKTATISFFSETPVENIDATTHQAMSLINAENGELVFKMQIKTFQFEKALMQEHFNEKYLESDKYPDATFKGQIADLSKVDFTKDGVYTVKVTGVLTIHGVAKDVTTDASITVKGGKVSAETKFPVTVADYEIDIPGAVKDNIAKVVEVRVKADYDPMNK